MSSPFLNSLKKSGTLSLVVSMVFFASMLFSAYLLFTLPHNLVMKGGLPTLELAWPVLINLFVSVGLTFILGIAAVNNAMQSGKETVVYLEKKKEDHVTAGKSDDGVAGELSDVSAFRAGLQQTKGERESLQQGLNTLCQLLQAGQGAIYQLKTTGGKKIVELKYGFALTLGETSAPQFEWGEGLIGQAAASGKSLYVDEVPEGYITIVSGLGTASPRYLLIVPIKKGDEVRGVLEIATFSPLHEGQRGRLEEMVQVLAEKIN
ncbi:MAG TPA: GAF domain-containing protein [Cyclobacteriaceae bacterium]|nr:GAF domain-containing protein [Cyclobacteriaceae bacterium]